MPSDSSSGASGKNPLEMVKHFLSMPNDTREKTIAVAVALCLVCSIIVSGAAVALKPLQIANKELDIQRNILRVAGLLESGTDVRQAFKSKIEARVVDLETGEFVDSVDANSYDQAKAAKDPAQNVKLAKDVDVAKIGSRAKYGKVYLVKDGDSVSTIILPVHGYGLWSTMYGFLALEPDANTIYGISFYQHAETPGLGGEIDNTQWQAKWQGKRLFADGEDVAFTVNKGPVDPGSAKVDYQVDGLAGATLTSNGVTNLVRYWMGQDGFGPFLRRIQSGQG